jgi:hypothetical protein
MHECLHHLRKWQDDPRVLEDLWWHTAVPRCCVVFGYNDHDVLLSICVYGGPWPVVYLSGDYVPRIVDKLMLTSESWDEGGLTEADCLVCRLS